METVTDGTGRWYFPLLLLCVIVHSDSEDLRNIFCSQLLTIFFFLNLCDRVFGCFICLEFDDDAWQAPWQQRRYLFCHDYIRVIILF